MHLNFAAIIADLGPDFALRFLNARRTPAEYLLNGFLPEQNRATYDVKRGSMTIRSTMAGMVGMDSPYPPGGMVEAESFLEQTVKLANDIPLSEAVTRELHQLMAAAGQDAASDDRLRNVVLNFLEKVVIQPHWDTAEFLRGQALTTGALSWEFNGITLDVDYGIPAANLFAQRTGNDGYGGSSSDFWADHRSALSLLKNSVRGILAHPNTINMVVANPVNNVVITSQDLATGSFSFVKNIGTVATGPFNPSPDVRDRVTMIGYGMEGEVLDPTSPTVPTVVPFIPEGYIVYIGSPAPRQFTVGLGSTTEDPENALALGYTHLAPTVENGGAPGRWARVFTPDERPWQVRGQGVSNILPVVDAPDKLVVLSTVMV